MPEWVACLTGWWPWCFVVTRRSRAVVVGGGRLDDGHVGRRVQRGGLGGRRREQPQRVETGGRGRAAEHATGLQVEHGRAGGQHHPHPLRLERDDLRVAELVELHLQGLLAGDQGVGLVLQRGRGEGRLLHRGVEEEEAHDAADGDHRDHEQERHRAAATAPPLRDDGETCPLEGGAGQTRDPGPEGRCGAAHAGSPRRGELCERVRGVFIRLLLWLRDGPVRRRAAGPRRRGGCLRSRRRRRARRPG